MADEEKITKTVFEAFKDDVFERLDKIVNKNTEEHEGLHKRLKPIEEEYQERVNISRLGMKIGNGLIFVGKVVLAIGVIYGVLYAAVNGFFMNLMNKTGS